MPDWARLIIAALIGASLALVGQGLLFGSWAQTGTSSSNSFKSSVANVKASGQSLADLNLTLAELQSNQRQLQGELTFLREQLAQGPVNEIIENGASSSGPQNSSQDRPPNGALTVERLIETGLAQDQADALVQRLDELALARLDADYRLRQAADDRELNLAVREERRRIPRDAAAIRDEFGDTAYDSYLYASGQPNRVEVASVLRSSSAVSAGLQSGDVLRSLDGKPLYSVRDLTAQVRAGGPDQTYALSFERDGQVMEVWVPGGPLGVRVAGRSVAPDS